VSGPTRADLGDVAGLDWAPDGKTVAIFVAMRRATLYLVDVAPPYHGLAESALTGIRAVR
jgi:hypothetical protein